MEFPKESAFTSTEPAKGVISTSLLSSCYESSVLVKLSADMVDISAGRNTSAERHSPLSNTALMLCEATPIGSLRVPPVSLSKDRAPPSSLMIPMLHTMRAVSPRRAIDKVAHWKSKTR